MFITILIIINPNQKSIYQKSIYTIKINYPTPPFTNSIYKNQFKIDNYVSKNNKNIYILAEKTPFLEYTNTKKNTNHPPYHPYHKLIKILMN